MSPADSPEGFDPLTVEVWQHLFAALCEEMGAQLERSAFSANIVERRDFSCALFDRSGHMVAQAAHLPVHLGSAPRSVQAVLARVESGRLPALVPGDAVLLNDPFEGGTHLPDLTLVAPVFASGASAPPDFFVATRAHHADIGGPFPGSMGPSAEIHAEGLRIPPVRVVRAGQLEDELVDWLLANVRVPDERRGDLLAQWAAVRLGEERLIELAARHGAATLEARARDQIEWTGRLARERIERLPAGTAEFTDTLELAGALQAEGGEEAKLHVRVERKGSRLRFDLRGCCGPVAAPINAPRPVTEAAAFYVLRCLLPAGTPTNHGLWSAIELVTEPGSLVDARYPAAVAAGNVETSQRLVDLLFGGLAALGAEEVPAASSGTMANLSFGEDDGGSGFAHYETHGGGTGAGPVRAGVHAVQAHMTNTRNTPIEVLERRFPVRVVAAGVRTSSGGAGARRGGDGQFKHLRFERGTRVAWLSGRTRRGPWGLDGGSAGQAGGARSRTSSDSAWTPLEPSESRSLPAGAELRLDTPGGGGHGLA